MKRIIIISVIVITIILLIWGVYYMFFSDRPRKVDKISGIKIFHYSYSVGYHYEARIYYELECENKCTLKIKDEGITEEDAPVYEVDKEITKKLEAILNKYSVGSWNGFSKSDHNVLDGDSFSLYLRTEDDDTVEASGYMKWPKNYEEVKEEIISFFDKYKKVSVE